MPSPPGRCQPAFCLHDNVDPLSPYRTLAGAAGIGSIDSNTKSLPILQPTLSQYDQKIDILQKMLAVIQKNRASSLRSVNHLLPIHRLPTEILHEVFLDACTSDASPVCLSDHGDLQDVSETPLRIAAVCTHWREICISSPHCWTFVFIDADDVHLSACVENLAVLYQERSSSKPFACSISAKYHQGYEDEVLELENPTIPYISLKTLFSDDILDFSKCRLLTLDLIMGDLSDLSTPSPQFTSLECLHLKGYYVYNTFDGVSSPLFVNAPLLSELRLFNTRCMVGFELPWAQIRTVWLQCYDQFGDAFEDMFAIIEHFPRLETLVLQEISQYHLSPLTDSMTKEGVRTLRVLSIRASAIFRVLRLPDLQCLEFVDETPDVNALLPFLASSPALTHIRFDNLAIRDTDLLRILDETPELKRLAVVECKEVPKCFAITDELLVRLQEPSGFLTKLEHVDLVWAENNEIEEGKVLDALQVRHGCGMLMSAVIGVRGGGELKESTLARIQSLREQKMSVCLY